MTPFVESLSRLYKDKKINKGTLDGFLADKTITRLEYEYIVSSANPT